MNTKIFAYIRVSTKEQNTDRQSQAISDYCLSNNIEINDRDIYIDKASGKNFNRPQYQALKLNLRQGDTLIIKELDRLGRNMEHIKEEWQDMIKSGINVIVIDTPILNTANKSDLEKNLISNIVFELLSYMAEKERLKIRQRQAEGIAALKLRNNGKGIGRPKAEYPKEFEKVYTQWKAGNITAVEAMADLSLKKNTFYNLVKRYENTISSEQFN
ncbi:recombinase family protein [Clostridium sp. HMP27]|uniref:recombinase family protein n=1 Tax=Clostridium sp. HMP27 TaxID=1487921 RepID=UPI00068CD112|nr:recombinase family protein [Clostridium sp. HMP27]